MIRGYLMSNLSRNLVHLMWLLKLVDFRAAGQLSWGWNHSASYVGIPTALEDIWLLLDQQSKVHDPWQVIFTVGRAEASTNSRRKGTTGPFKSKEKG
ncbi:hypothetical protein Godav_002894 [Gossypium davidsonii]|uniref:Uncharacterized protein n=1 Tax=Gossypium davidsonii TaxID=34287 RepID=A0A7J8SYD3_GOSDV|nr:hypothetical protein [Gossypium davidsonii]